MSLTYVYVVAKRERDKLVAPVKVGITANPSKRLDQIQTACPFPAGIMCCFACPNREAARSIERAFHDVEDGRNLHGEWFDIEPHHAAWKVMRDFADYWHRRGYSHRDSGAYVEASMKMCEHLNEALYA